jgi:hypothetical protein
MDDRPISRTEHRGQSRHDVYALRCSIDHRCTGNEVVLHVDEHQNRAINLGRCVIRHHVHISIVADSRDSC